MRTIVIADIHGCYNELKTLFSNLLEKEEYDKQTDKLIFLGDYIDRGNDSRLVINFIQTLQKESDNVIALMGNHEYMFLDYYDNCGSWINTGREKTLESYNGFNEQFKSDVQWMRNLPLYYEDEYFIYVHAGVDTNKSIDKQSMHTLLFARDEFIYDEKEYYKKVIFGHTPTLSITGKDKPIYTINNNLGIDTGCVYGGSLSALIIEDDKIKYCYRVKKI